MKYLAIIIFSIALSCTHKQQDSSLLLNNANTALRDSVVTLIIQFQQGGDSVLLKRALIINDELLETSRTTKDSLYDFNTRIQLLALLGRPRDAFLLKDNVISKDPNNINRLIYDAQRYDLAGRTDSAEYLYSLAIRKCDILLKDSIDINIVVNKLDIYAFQGKRKEIKQMFEELQKSVPDNEMLITLNQESDTLLQMSLRLRKTLSEK